MTRFRVRCLPTCLALVFLLAGCDGDGRPDAGPSGRDDGLVDVGAADGGAGADPIAAPLRTWTWVPIDGAVCANGSPTGIGVNLSDASPNVAIFLQGGGACWSEATCYDEPIADNLDGIDGDDFEGVSFTIFRRDLAVNPLADWSYVFVPYCTGDIHAGDRTATYGGRVTEHRGHRNMALALARLRATFVDVERVVLSGASAGGYGSTLNLPQTRAAFPGVRVDLLNDSGHFLAPPSLPASRLAQWREAWGLERTLPEGCAGCATDLSAFYAYVIAEDPAARVALLTFAVDPIIAAYFGVEDETFATGLDAHRAAQIDPAANAAAFVVDGEGHVMFEELDAIRAGGRSGLDFVRAMLEDEPGWGSR